jgi:DNA-binding NarL/FixJ family response regulator
VRVSELFLAMKKIILADNQSIFRAGVAKTLALQDDIRIIAQCTDNERLAQAIRTFRSSIVIFASSLKPDLPQLIHSTQALTSKLIVIAENMEPLHTYANHGFSGVVFRDITGPELVDCVNAVAGGQNYLQQKSGRSLTEETDAVGARVRDRLTAKEIRIVGLIVQGYKNKEIASSLGTTEQVIKNYLRNVYDKTGVSDRLELALFTIHHRTLAEAAAQAGGEMELQTARA